MLYRDYRDYRDILSGALLILFGSVVFIYSWLNLAFGSLERMGPGMFPSGVAVLIICLGIAVMIPAFFREGEKMQRPDLRSMVAILSAILAFMFLLEPFGVIAALLALVLISTLADCKLTLVKAVVLGLTLSALIIVIFRFGFGLKITLFSWPW